MNVYLEKWSFVYKNDKREEWIARDDSGTGVASGKTKEECETKCRLLGYVPKEA